MLPPEAPIFWGLYADDLRRMAEIFLISVAGVATLLIFVRPVIVLVSEAVAAKRRVQWDDFSRHAKTGGKLLLRVIGIVVSFATALISIVLIVAPVCEDRKDACIAGADILSQGAVAAISAYYLSYGVFRMSRYGAADPVGQNKIIVGATVVAGAVGYMIWR
jgi:hypothetical protein